MGSARINAKEREKERQVRRRKKRKRIEAQSVKPSAPSQATDAHIGDEEQRGNQKKNKRKKQGSGPQSSYTGSFGGLLRPAWIILFAYSETPPPTGENSRRGKQKLFQSLFT